MFNWWTFFFQTINFFVVLYILYKLFFKPLKEIIQKRDDDIKRRIEELNHARRELDIKEEAYLQELQELELLKEKEINDAKTKAEEEKERIIYEGENELEKQRLRQESIQEYEKEKLNSAIKEKSLSFSIDFISSFAAEIVDEHIHKKLIERFLYEMTKDKDGELEKLRNEPLPKGYAISIVTPLKIDDETLATIQRKIEEILDIRDIPFKTSFDKSLIDGSIAGKLRRLEQEASKEL